jgi:hypothetical protein
MVPQYASGLLALALAKDPSLLKKPRMVGLIASLRLLSSKFGEFRTLLRLFGLLPIIQWYDNLSQVAHPPSRYTHTLEKLQALSLLCYYPLEHVAFFASRGILPGFKPSTLVRMGRASCQFWMAYTVFKLLHIFEDMRVQAVQRSQAGISSGAEMSVKERNTRESLIVNGAYFPMTVHWCVAELLIYCVAHACLDRSVPGGVLPDEMLTQGFGLIAAVWQIRALWRNVA